ncbi:spore coat protein CotH [Paenibacillus darwinianus]|uniref:Spore coat protein CotH n=1 Tax=Paenibacillus darwinianus TaxID=1380763 RepID=A0A9W5W5Z0_9BACL|nr:CotH kinase family protein [Paenibacillus darwinianus]EXX84583.1 spore coat protein CotH [Paenibacillus darwinianus]EXX84592.1 spore coat protein CotH [Paenibacillus darwinianus]EXX84616.1 spore coat protein CotH [Paenibacillus darwinianus]
MPAADLPVRRIIVEPYLWSRLHQDPWNRSSIPVQIALKNRTLDARIRIRGGHTRSYPKKSYEISVEGGLTFHWNTEYDDPSLIRNALSFYFFNRIGLPAPRTSHCRLSVNGSSLGVYLEIEAVKPIFFRARRIGQRSIVYAVNDHAHFGLMDSDSGDAKSSLFSGYEKVAGDNAASVRLVRFIHDINRLKGAALRRRIAAKLDTAVYLRWLAGAVLTGNYDGFEQNYALYEHANTGKYRIIPWDYEGTWGRNCYGNPCKSDLVNIQGYNILTEKLLSFPVYRNAYKQLLKKLLRTIFRESALMPVVNRMHGRIADDIRADTTRKHPYSVFQSEPGFIRSYIRERRSIVLAELRKWK